MATVIYIKESKQTPSAMRGCINYCVQEKKTVDKNGRQYFDWQKAVEYLNTSAHKGNENAYRALQNMNRNTVVSITTGIADLLGDLSAMFGERPTVEDCTTMPQHRERKKYDYEQSM